MATRRRLVPLAAVAVVVAVIVAVMVAVTVTRDSGTVDEVSPKPVETASDLPADEGHEHEGDHDHEGDHVDDVDPDIDPARYVPFCEAFYVFAGAYSSALETLNQTGEAPAQLVSAATDFRALAAGAEMTDEVRAGFEWFVDDVLRVPNDASTEEQMAWSTFLNSACPA